VITATVQERALDRNTVRSADHLSPADAGPRHTDLQAVLEAWQVATNRLEETHQILQREVRRLSDELEIKNRELARKNRLADLGQMASHVAHEVRNSLVPLTLYLSLLRRHLDQLHLTATSEILDKIEAGFTALEAIVNDLLQFTAHQIPTCQTFDLDSLVMEVCESLAPQLDAQGIRMELDIPVHLAVNADRNMMRRATLNLILNALDAMPQGGELAVTGLCGPQGVELEIADSGPGIAGDANRQLFEPFFTTKSGGTGLGLTIVDRIAAAHGGSVDVANCPQGGAAFTIRLPAPHTETTP
jgi:signal transduction histidine kinase